ncbi:MAG TPA: YggS family pyridoxal phosphate-dependent enzyme [Candidatus Dormibacteraeota bacterium]
MTGPELSTRLAALRDAISQCERSSDRDQGSVALLPVTKGHPPEVAELAVAAGLSVLGENYVQECLTKAALLAAAGAGPVRWRLLGHLQRNKVGRAVEIFSAIESLDSWELAQRLSQARAGRPPLPVLCEVELTGLPRRTGFSEAQLVVDLERLVDLPGIEVTGLMTVAGPSNPGPTFAAARDLLELLRQRSGLPLSTLSMGMSADFQVAIAEGSTEVRIGSLLFGRRAD